MANNPYQTTSAKIIKITEQAPNIKLFRFDVEKKLDFEPGQIVFMSIPGFGEAPFAPCNPLESDFLELCVRKVGKLTQIIHKLKVGDSVGIRGPYGSGWPIWSSEAELRDNAELRSATPKNLLLVVGGLGLVPLRTLIWGKDKLLS